MNDRQQKFAELVFSGRPAGRAYEEAGYSQRGALADASASRLMTGNEMVKAHLAKLREAAEGQSVSTYKERLEILARIAIKQEHTDPRISIAAVTELNRMTGSYEPERHELEIIVTIGGSTTAG
jgi:phage terminase small subunit